jgi:hypothetical protein
MLQVELVTLQSGQQKLFMKDDASAVVSCCPMDVIITAANRVWERGQSDNWYNPAAIVRRGYDANFVKRIGERTFVS